MINVENCCVEWAIVGLCLPASGCEATKHDYRHKVFHMSGMKLQLQIFFSIDTADFICASNVYIALVYTVSAGQFCNSIISTTVTFPSSGQITPLHLLKTRLPISSLFTIMLSQALA